ncbi:type II secretion system F family protein [Candidatus Sumerlaeota bacterium]|nr:type II secretion system F family protein [Candidatus Sumerlaeota bacterium]
MATFTYKALGANGEISEGSIEAAKRQDALQQLERLGLSPIGLKEREAETPKKAKHLSEVSIIKKAPFKAVENFTRQLASLLASGVPLSRALHLVQREAANPVAQAQWKKIHDLVIDGSSLADAMAQLPQTFPRVYVAMVRAGETGGFLDLVLRQIAEFQTNEKELRSRVVAALIYPAVLLVLALGVLTFLLIYFIPKFQVIFQGFGGELPLLTQMIVGASALAKKYGIFLIGGGIALYIVSRQWIESEAGRRQWQRWILRAPLFGLLVSRFALTRFSRMLGTLFEAGVPLIQALRVARESLGNQTLIDAIDDAILRVQQGDPLAASLRDCPQLFTGSIVEMIFVAEESGRLGEELIRISGEMEKELDRQLKIAVSLAEPLMLFCMAAFIGTIFIGMVIPIFTIQDYIK